MKGLRIPRIAIFYPLPVYFDPKGADIGSCVHLHELVLLSLKALQSSYPTLHPKGNPTYLFASESLCFSSVKEINCPEVCPGYLA